MSWSEAKIARALCHQTFQRKCLLLVDNCNWTGHECDILAVTTDLRIIDVEVKISRADLKADAGKEKWWHRQPYFAHREERPPRQHREHPPRVWKHYYAMPADIWTPELVSALGSPASGVLLLSENFGGLSVRSVRRAKPAKDAYRLSEQQAMDIARLANLRMWEAYAARDRVIEREARRCEDVTGGK